MIIFEKTIQVYTKGKGTYEITDEVSALVKQSKISLGTATVFVKHTSASLIIYENADPSARVDLEAYFEHLVPENTPYFTHIYEGPDDMPSHIRMVLTRTSETIPISAGKLCLGTWQGIFVFEHRQRSHKRNLQITLIGK